MLRPEQGDVGLDCWLGPVPVQKFLYPRSHVGEQDIVHELDGRRRALDVQEDGTDVRQREALRSGM